MTGAHRSRVDPALALAWLVGAPLASLALTPVAPPDLVAALVGARWWVPAVVGVVLGSGLVAVPLGALAALSPLAAQALSRGRELAAAAPLVVSAWILGRDAGAAPWVAVLVGLGWRGIALAGVVRMETLQALAGPAGRASLALGATPWRVALRHAAPAAVPGVLAAGALGAVWLVLLDAAGSLVRAAPPGVLPGWGALLVDEALPGVGRVAVVGALVASAFAGRALLAAALPVARPGSGGY